MWHKQGFLKTFLLKVAFILIELMFVWEDAHLFNAMMCYRNANMPCDCWYEVATYGADVLLQLVNAPMGSMFAMTQCTDAVTYALMK